MSTQETIQCKFTWQTGGADPCQKCASLNGLSWIQDINEPVLHDPFFGDLWDLDADQSLVHPNCKCSLLVSVELHLEEWPELQEFQIVMEGMKT
jgi:hypothetical protein